MGVYRSCYICIGRLSNTDNINTHEKIICKVESTYLISIKEIDDIPMIITYDMCINDKCHDLNVIKALCLKQNIILDDTLLNNEYKFYVVYSTFMSFNHTRNISYMECIECDINDSKNRLELLYNVFEKNEKKEKKQHEKRIYINKLKQELRELETEYDTEEDKFDTSEDDSNF